MPFTVFSLESLSTANQDLDVGVVRVSAHRLRCLGGRGSLVKIMRTDSKKTKPIVRIIRAATGNGRALRHDQIALQYDDRLALGIKEIGACYSYNLELERVHDWFSLPKFLLGHSSPLVRKEAAFGIALMIVGVVLGAGLGFFVGLWF